MITAQEARSVVAKAVNSVDINDLGDDTDFTDAGIDSLDQSTILLEIQERYGVEIPDDEVDQCTTIRNLAEVTNRHLEK